MGNNLAVSGPISLLTESGTAVATYYEGGGRSGVTVKFGALDAGTVLLRVQSSCMFSESLGAIDCDCNSQLKASLQSISRNRGLLLYVFEEGRGVGLKAKFEAVLAQQRDGVDTGAAFEALGYERDPRDYGFASTVIKREIGDLPVCLITNNPTRVHALREAGVGIVATQRLVLRTDAVAAYLDGKASALGHELSDDN